MPTCVFRKCTNYDSKVTKAHGVTYHMFPTDVDRLKEWIAIVRVQRHESDWTPSKRSRICSEHFNDIDRYSSNKGRTLLMKHAVPFIPDQNFLNPLEDKFESLRNEALKNRIRILTHKGEFQRTNNEILSRQNKGLRRRVTRLQVKLYDLKKKVLFYESQVKSQRSLPLNNEFNKCIEVEVKQEVKEEDVEYHQQEGIIFQIGGEMPGGPRCPTPQPSAF